MRRDASLLLDALAVSGVDDAARLARDLLRISRGDLDEPDLYLRVKLLGARLKTDLFLELLARSRPRLGALVTYPTDAIAHRYWQYHDPELDPSVPADLVARRGEAVRDAYRTADRTLGKVLDRIDPDRTTLVVVSDHGMEGVPPRDRPLLIRGTALCELLGMAGDLNAATASIRNLALTAKAGGEAGSAALTRAQELLASAAYEGRPGEPFRVVRPEENPGILILQMADVPPWEERIRIGERSATVEELCVRDGFSSDHTRSGVLAIVGPGVKPGATVDAVLVDVAPTVLHALGLEIPEALEGRVLAEAYRPEWMESRPPRFRPGAMTLPLDPGEISGDEELVNERLRALGYVR